MLVLVQLNGFISNVKEKDKSELKKNVFWEDGRQISSSSVRFTHNEAFYRKCRDSVNINTLTVIVHRVVVSSIWDKKATLEFCVIALQQTCENPVSAADVIFMFV